jgi:hypothetical protein
MIIFFPIILVILSIAAEYSMANGWQPILGRNCRNNGVELREEGDRFIRV